MSKEKIQNLQRYIESHKNRLSSPTPEKHKNHPEAYKQYLQLEITKAQKKLDKLLVEAK